jgi:GNAT-like C-terminal domain/N-acyltransferase N-terminal domain
MIIAAVTVTNAWVSETCAVVGIPQAIAPLTALLTRIEADPVLSAMHADTMSHLSTREGWTEAAQAFVLNDADGDRYVLLIALAFMRQMIENQRARGIPEAIIRATADDLRCACAEWEAKPGRPGLDHTLYFWYRWLSRGTLYQLGRLQFMPITYEEPVRMYRHRRTRQLQAIADAGMKLGPDGRFADDGQPVPFEQTETHVHGLPLLRSGYAGTEPITLDLSAWAQVLGPGDPVIDWHIPDPGPYTLEAHRDAFARAEVFMAQYHPAHEHKAYVCNSWLFDPTLERLLSPESRILQLQRIGYRVPGTYIDPKAGLWFIFNERQVDMSNPPRDTHLRRAVADLYAAGGHIRFSGFIVLRDDLAAL